MSQHDYMSPCAQVSPHPSRNGRLPSSRSPREPAARPWRVVGARSSLSDDQVRIFWWLPQGGFYTCSRGGDHIKSFMDATIPDYSGYSSAGYSGPRTAPRVAYGFTSPPMRQVSRLLLRYVSWSPLCQVGVQRGARHDCGRLTWLWGVTRVADGDDSHPITPNLRRHLNGRHQIASADKESVVFRLHFRDFCRSKYRSTGEESDTERRGRDERERARTPPASRTANDTGSS
ncbi:hypothetical protein BHM03_00041872 [Ensete ventricosum]|nr:hypothetical protein BHM03_00041872 [Ensete ventricosum]